MENKDKTEFQVQLEKAREEYRENGIITPEIAEFLHEYKEKSISKKKYGLKINYELYEVFEGYMNKHPELGYRSVAEFLIELIRNKAKKILKDRVE